LKLSLINENLGFRVLYVDIREAAEFRDYSSVALSVFYWCKF